MRAIAAMAPKSTIDTAYTMRRRTSFSIASAPSTTPRMPKLNEIAYSVNTARFTPPTARLTMWWMWFASAVDIGTPASLRRRMASDVSMIGSAKMMSPANTRWVSPCSPSMRIDTTTRYPMSRLPQSPRKMTAGLKFQGRNPSTAPSNARQSTMRTPASDSKGSLMGVPAAMISAMARSAVAWIAAVPEHRPSRPSIRFMALQPPSTNRAMIAVPVQ